MIFEIHLMKKWKPRTKNLKNICFLLIEQIVKELVVVEEEEQLVLADLRVVIITAMTVIMLYIVHWGASDFYHEILADWQID